MGRHKLSASALSQYLRSPRAYYWRYVAKLEPITLSVASFDHDKICGILWSAFVARFYAGIPEGQNTDKLLTDWAEQTQGWVPPAALKRLTTALESWAANYYRQFAADDGCRVESEKLVENERFLGYLDGWNPETRILHEVKSTSRSPQISEQMWKVANSLQVRLYCVLTQAEGLCIEFAYKDVPNAILRGPVQVVSKEQLQRWELELNALADSVYALGDNPDNYPCHPDGCCIVTKNMTAMCGYQSLCDMGLTDETRLGYRAKERRAN